MFGGWAKAVAALTGARLSLFKKRLPVILISHRRAKDLSWGVRAVRGEKWTVYGHCASNCLRRSKSSPNRSDSCGVSFLHKSNTLLSELPASIDRDRIPT